MSANGGEVPRLQSQDVSADSLQAPHLRGEHGQLQSWITQVLERLRLETKEDLGKVHAAINSLAGRVSAIEGGEAERGRWRERVEEKLDHALGAVPAAQEATKAPWWAALLTERTISLLAVVGMAAMLVWFVAADRFGLERVDQSIDHHLGRNVPAAK
jgi:hypothetical protein